jgi:para-nitrobenzyl esterase
MFGESAGGMSVGTQLGLPASRGLVARAIAQSGAATTVHDGESGERVARQVLDALGVAPVDLEALLDLPPEAFTEVQAKVSADSRLFLALPFSPTVDGTTLPVPPIEALDPEVPLLIGTNEQEMKLWSMMAAFSGQGAPAVDEAKMLRRIGRQVERVGAASDPADVVATYRRRLGADATPAEVLEAVGTDMVFRLPAIRLAEARTAGADAFMYLFTHATSSFDGALGSAHATEIPFVFDNLDQPGTTFLVGDVTPERRVLATTMADAWVAFARTGDPSTPALGPWPAYDPDRRATMRLDTACEVVDDPHGDERRVWNG